MNANDFNILIVDDEIEYQKVLKKILSVDGYYIQTASSGEEALMKMKHKKYNLVLTDLMMDGLNGIELLEEIKAMSSETEVILVTGFGTVQNAVESMKKGAYSYFIKGNDPSELQIEVRKVHKLHSLKNENTVLKLTNTSKTVVLTSKNEAFTHVIEVAQKAAKSNVNILLLGESGVGKEVFARFIHNTSFRNANPFIAVNCHAFQDTVLESELFGHNKGSFTGAVEDRLGRFEAAHGGTLFLDEIADTPLTTQIKLLRSIENKQIERIGSNQTIDVDFRLITATNKKIHELIEKELFREDFYYRISTITIEIPPLRERREDIKDLIDFFIKEASLDMKKNIDAIEPDLLSYLLDYDYPGNIRELKNMIERLVVLSDNGELRLSDLTTKSVPAASYKTKTLKELRFDTETEHIKRILEKTEFNMNEAAEILGISRRQLFNRVNELDLKK